MFNDVFQGRRPDKARIESATEEIPGVADDYVLKVRPDRADMPDDAAMLAHREKVQNGIVWRFVASNGDSFIMSREDAQICENTLMELRLDDMAGLLNMSPLYL